MEQMIQLSGKQRAALRKIAANLDTIFQIGKGGIGENMLRQISDTLDARELIKLRVLDTAEYTASSAAQEIANALHAAVVQCIGTRFVLYRPNPDKAKKSEISANKKRPTHRSNSVPSNKDVGWVTPVVDEDKQSVGTLDCMKMSDGIKKNIA